MPMKSFAPRSQRDRTFDRLVQQASNNHAAALLSRSVPICKTASTKSPPVIQRPVSPRKCVTITTFVGDDDGEACEGPKSDSGNVKSKLSPLSGKPTQARVTSPSVPNNSHSDSRSNPSVQEPLRVTFRLQKCPSSPSKTRVSTSPAVSSSSDDVGIDSGSFPTKPLNAAPLTLSFKRKPESASASSSGSAKWVVASSSRSKPSSGDSSSRDKKPPEPMLSSPPIIMSKVNSGESVGHHHGTKRKTEGGGCEQLTSFVAGIEERALPKRRMLQHPTIGVESTASGHGSTSGLASGSDSPVSEKFTGLSSTKTRNTNSLSQKILMSKAQSLPTDVSTASESGSAGVKRKPFLLKKDSSAAANRKAIYNPRQWIKHDTDDEHGSNPSTSKSKFKPDVKDSTFDFDSDEETTDCSPSPPTDRRHLSRSVTAPSATSKPAAPVKANIAGASSSSSAVAATSLSSSSVNSKPLSSSSATTSRQSTPPQGSSSSSGSGAPVRVERDQKALYTVVRNVKEAHECQESGETQDLLDDVEYMVDGLKKSESPATRCLSLLRLCKECLAHSFRMALKAHGLLARIFANISDAPSEECDSGVTLHAAALLFILSRDKLAAGDLDKAGLQLLLRLLRCDASGLNNQQARELDRTRARLRPVIEQMTKANVKSPTSSSYLQSLHSTRFTAKDLSAESLLNLSVRKASDWFKNELRKEGGLDHFCHATILAMEYFNNELESQDLTEFMLERLRRIEQYMRLLENMTYMNGLNQEYLVQFEERSFLDSIAACLRLCVNNMRRDLKTDSPTMKVLVACLLAIWRVLLNISHDNEKCSDRLGAHPLLVALSLHCILKLPRRLPAHRRFDLLVLSLGFLVNLVEHCDENRSRLAYTQVRLPWKKPKKARTRRRGLVFKPKTARSDSDSSSSEEDDSSGSSDEEDGRPKTALDSLVKLFLERYEASERLELEQQKDDKEAGGSADGAGSREAPAAEQEDEEAEEQGMKWRLIEDKQLERQRRGRHRPLQLLESKTHDSDGEPGDDDSDSDSGADVEFMPSTQEESAALESALSRAGEHMEASMTASYAALLLGCVMRGSRRRVDRVQTRLPDGRFRPLALSLAKFLGFMSLTSAVGQAGGKSMLEVVHFLHELDGESPDDEEAALIAGAQTKT